MRMRVLDQLNESHEDSSDPLNNTPKNSGGQWSHQNIKINQKPTSPAETPTNKTNNNDPNNTNKNIFYKSKNSNRLTKTSLENNVFKRATNKTKSWLSLRVLNKIKMLSKVHADLVRVKQMNNVMNSISKVIKIEELRKIEEEISLLDQSIESQTENLDEFIINIDSMDEEDKPKNLPPLPVIPRRKALHLTPAEAAAELQKILQKPKKPKKEKKFTKAELYFMRMEEDQNSSSGGSQEKNKRSLMSYQTKDSKVRARVQKIFPERLQSLKIWVFCLLVVVSVLMRLIINNVVNVYEERLIEVTKVNLVLVPAGYLLKESAKLQLVGSGLVSNSSLGGEVLSGRIMAKMGEIFKNSFNWAMNTPETKSIAGTDFELGVAPPVLDEDPGIDNTSFFTLYSQTAADFNILVESASEVNLHGFEAVLGDSHRIDLQIVTKNAIEMISSVFSTFEDLMKKYQKSLINSSIHYTLFLGVNLLIIIVICMLLCVITLRVNSEMEMMASLLLKIEKKYIDRLLKRFTRLYSIMTLSLQFNQANNSQNGQNGQNGGGEHLDTSADKNLIPGPTERQDYLKQATRRRSGRSNGLEKTLHFSKLKSSTKLKAKGMEDRRVLRGSYRHRESRNAPRGGFISPSSPYNRRNNNLPKKSRKKIYSTFTHKIVPNNLLLFSLISLTLLIMNIPLGVDYFLMSRSLRAIDELNSALNIATSIGSMTFTYYGLFYLKALSFLAKNQKSWNFDFGRYEAFLGEIDGVVSRKGALQAQINRFEGFEESITQSICQFYKIENSQKTAQIEDREKYERICARSVVNQEVFNIFVALNDLQTFKFRVLASIQEEGEKDAGILDTASFSHHDHILYFSSNSLDRLKEQIFAEIHIKLEEKKSYQILYYILVLLVIVVYGLSFNMFMMRSKRDRLRDLSQVYLALPPIIYSNNNYLISFFKIKMNGGFTLK